MENSAGVYSILCRPTDREYIGSSRNIGKRWSQHRARLASGSHSCPMLQLDWLMCDEPDFVFAVLHLEDDPRRRQIAEQSLIASRNSLRLYNKIKYASQQGHNPVNRKPECKTSVYLLPTTRAFVAKEQKRLKLPSKSKTFEAIISTYRKHIPE